MAPYPFWQGTAAATAQVQELSMSRTRSFLAIAVLAAAAADGVEVGEAHGDHLVLIVTYSLQQSE